LESLVEVSLEFDRIEHAMNLFGNFDENINIIEDAFNVKIISRDNEIRALALNPKFIVADEPISALDVSIQAQITNLLIDLQKELGLSFLFIAHDLSVIKHMCDSVLVLYLGKVMEYGSNADVFQHSRHPYTQALLSAVPVPDPDYKRERILLQGEIPSPIDPPPGCVFHTRCPYATEKCRTDKPELREVEPGHMVACHYA